MSGSNAGAVHRHRPASIDTFMHAHTGIFVFRADRSVSGSNESWREREHDHHSGHGHSHGLVDRSIVRSRAGVKAVSLSLAVLALAAGVQVAIFVLSGSVALLADLIHNFGDALTATAARDRVLLRSFRAR